MTGIEPTPSSTRPKRTSLADEVYGILLTRLTDGTVQAGSPLNIDALARDLAVSQTPIREALARLEATGLVHRAALKGYRVAPLFTDRELADLMDAREVIEPAIARLACARSDSKLLFGLGETISALESSAAEHGSGSLARYWLADERFHDLIAGHADNRFLRTAYESLGGHVQRFRLFGALGITDAEHAVAEHGAVLAAFERGDADGAREAMRTHIANVKDRAHVDRQAVAELD